MKRIITSILICATLFACKKEIMDEGVVARVNDKYLYASDLNPVLPEGLSKEDSLLYRNNYILFR